MPRSLAVNRSAASNRVGVQNFPCSLSFNGSSSVVKTSITPSTTAFGFMGWAKLSYSGVQFIVNACNIGNNLGFVFYTIPGKLIWQVYNGSSNTENTTTNISTSWCHYAICFDTTSNSIQLWVNGVNYNHQLSGTYGVPTGQTITYGMYSNATSNNLIGSLSNWSYMPSVITTTQVLANMQNGTIPSNALAVYPLTEGAGTTAYDISGNGNNGTITSGTYTSDVPSRARGLVGGNLVYNGNFEFAPPTNVAQTSSGWIDGTSGGSGTNNLFGWYSRNLAGSVNALFDSANAHSGNFGLKVSTIATGSFAGVENNNDNGGKSIPYGVPTTLNTKYTLTYWMKTTANSGAATTGAQVSIIEQGGNSLTSYQTVSSTGITTTTGWTQYSLSITSQINKGSYLDIYLRVIGNDGTATLIMDAWFDNIVLTPTVNTTRSLAV